MCEVRSKEKRPRTKIKKKYSDQQQNQEEPHLALNEKMQPIQWTEWPTGAVVAGSPWCTSGHWFTLARTPSRLA